MNVKHSFRKLLDWWTKAQVAGRSKMLAARGKLQETAGQGTTEYAILVGVLTVV